MASELTVQAPPLPAGHCPVCAGTLGDGRVVACARCETAHHLDCIEYGGGCAVYACGSRAYRRPGARLEFVARPAPAATALVKHGAELGEVVQTLRQPVLRVESRRSAHATRNAALVAACAVAGVWCLAYLSPVAWLSKLLVVGGALRDLLSTGLWPILVLALTAVTIAYLTISIGGQAMLYGLGMLAHHANAGQYVLDRERRRLVHRPRFAGVPGVETAWDAGAIRAVRLIAEPGTERVRLEVVLDDGPLVLADDANTYMLGYHWSELARLGTRLAAELDVPLEWLVPWKPHPGQKKIS